MFKSLLFENFKVFKKIEIENLSRINLFFGKNNSGKTTALEALFLLSGIANPDVLSQLNDARGFKFIKDFSYFFHDFDTLRQFILESDGDIDIFKRRYEARTEQMIENSINLKSTNHNEDSVSIITNRPEAHRIEIKLKLGNEEMTAIGSLKRIGKTEQRKITLPRKYVEKIDCIYIPPSTSVKNFVQLFADMVIHKEQKPVVDALQCIDKRIKDLVLVQDEVMVDVGLKGLFPLNLLGGGVNKAFNIMTAICNYKDGVILVDEIDNGLHFSVMKDFLNLIIKTAHTFNVQIFMTTHSIDIIKAMNSILLSDLDIRDDVSAYKIMRRDNDEHKALYYDAEKFNLMIDTENELR